MLSRRSSVPDLTTIEPLTHASLRFAGVLVALPAVLDVKIATLQQSVRLLHTLHVQCHIMICTSVLLKVCCAEGRGETTEQVL